MVTTVRNIFVALVACTAIIQPDQNLWGIWPPGVASRWTLSYCGFQLELILTCGPYINHPIIAL